MVEQRKHTRYKTLAKTEIEGISEKESLLKDLSITGCLVECTSYAGIECNKQYKLDIIPESAAKIREFELVGEARWIRIEDYSCEVGFVIVKSPRGKLFQRYVDYLSWRYSHGNSMTGCTNPEIPQEV